MVIMVYRMLAQDIVRSQNEFPLLLIITLFMSQVHVHILHFCHGLLPGLLCPISGKKINIYLIFVVV